jgi:large subunit ribosomal protein L10
MPTVEKEATIRDLTDKIRRARLAVVTDYRGLTVRDLAALRRQLRPFQVEYSVTKNTLLRIAARDGTVEGLDVLLTGPTAVAFCYADVVGASKALTEFARTSRILTIRGGVLDGRPIAADDVTRLAALPSVEHLRAEVVGAIGGPLAALVGVLNGVLQALVATLEARAEQQAGAVPAPA